MFFYIISSSALIHLSPKVGRNIQQGEIESPSDYLRYLLTSKNWSPCNRFSNINREPCKKKILIIQRIWNVRFWWKFNQLNGNNIVPKFAYECYKNCNYNYNYNYFSIRNNYKTDLDYILKN